MSALLAYKQRFCLCLTARPGGGEGFRRDSCHKLGIHLLNSDGFWLFLNVGIYTLIMSHFCWGYIYCGYRPYWSRDGYIRYRWYRYSRCPICGRFCKIISLVDWLLMTFEEYIANLKDSFSGQFLAGFNETLKQYERHLWELEVRGWELYCRTCHVFGLCSNLN